MKVINTTDFRDGKALVIYECEWCGLRRRERHLIERCEINCHHKEEAWAGIL